MLILGNDVQAGVKIEFESHFKGNMKGVVYAVFPTYLVVDSRMNGRQVHFKVDPTCVTEVTVPYNPERTYTYSDIKIHLG